MFAPGLLKLLAPVFPSAFANIPMLLLDIIIPSLMQGLMMARKYSS